MRIIGALSLALVGLISAAQAGELPASQKAFCEAIETGRAAYTKAAADTNRLRGSQAKAAAVEQLNKTLAPILMSDEFRGWVGKVADVTQLPSGRAYVSVALPCGAELSTIDKSAVAPDSAVFQTVAALDVGTVVRLSGRLVPHPSRPGQVYEMSFTEQGRVEAPEYAFAFTGLEPIATR